MRSFRHQKLSGALALWAGVGCATAIVDDEAENTDDGAAAASATGGTTVAANGGTSGTSPAGGSTGLPSGGGSGNAGAAGLGGRFGTAGSPAGAGRTGGGVVGSAGASAGGSSVATCPAPRMPDQPGAAQGNSGSFETTDAVCYFVEGTFNTWNCSNIGGRTVTINGVPSMCGGSLPAKVDGGYYFEFGAATDGTTYTSFYWYTS